MKSITLLAVLVVGVFSLGFTSFAEAHPHISLEIMDTHSHEILTSQDFVIHTFEQVVLFVSQLQSVIFR